MLALGGAWVHSTSRSRSAPKRCHYIANNTTQGQIVTEGGVRYVTRVSLPTSVFAWTLPDPEVIDPERARPLPLPGEGWREWLPNHRTQTKRPAEMIAPFEGSNPPTFGHTEPP